jgi:hypothetical protein
MVDVLGYVHDQVHHQPAANSNHFLRAFRGEKETVRTHAQEEEGEAACNGKLNRRKSEEVDHRKIK